MRWADLDLERAEWTQVENKSDRRHVVPLSGAAAALVGGRPRRGALVFTTAAGGRLDARSGNWDRFTKGIAERSGVAGWSRHDLRRTAATMLAELKVERVVIELLLNHSERAAKGGAVASIYNRHSYAAEKRNAVEKLAERVAAIAAGRTGKVLELPARAG
jgi:integrase